MNTSDNKYENINAKDPIDILIFEKGLRIKNVVIDKELDLIGVILNNGIGIRWEDLDEDLSAKGFIHSAAINDMIEHLQVVPSV